MPKAREYAAYINKKLAEEFIPEVSSVINQNNINTRQQRVVSMDEWREKKSNEPAENIGLREVA